VDVWVNNAGVASATRVADVEMPAPPANCSKPISSAPLVCLQAVVPALREAGGGTIINISSVAGHIPVPFMTLYSASKFALNALGKGARLELQRDHINVLTVCPATCAPISASMWWPIGGAPSARNLFKASRRSAWRKPPIVDIAKEARGHSSPGP